MQLVLIWKVELPVAFFVRCAQSTGMVLSLFWSGGLPPQYAPVIAILNNEGRFDQKTTSFKANVPNMNFFFVKSQMKNLKNTIVLHIPTAYNIITAHTSYYIMAAHSYNCNQSNIVPKGTKQPKQPKESHKFVHHLSELISPQLDYSSAHERFVTCFGLYTSTGRFYCTNFKIFTAIARQR